MNAGVFIAMPVYRGTEVIEETLRSILAQTHDDFHLVMSVDGADDPTIEICRKYENDPRIDVVVQETHLGWPGNFNWLVDNCDREFFCYWQQDDLASTGYLDSLQRELLARPDASIAYTDVQWFGGRFDREGTPSIEGDPLSRVMQHIEAIRYQPLRGLMRKTMLPQGVAAIPVTEDESCQEEFVFLAHMAAAGTFIRVDSAMYFKRLHGTNAFVRWWAFPDWRRRRGWISMGAGMYRVARAVAPPELRPRLLGLVLDRLAIHRPGRDFFYLPSQSPTELSRFVRDFVAYREIAVDDLRPADPSDGLGRPIHLAVLRALGCEEARAQTRSDLQLRFKQGRSLTVELNEEDGEALLGFGWSTIEPWGVWSDGGEATIRIPAPPGSSWKATIQGRVHAPDSSARVSYRQDQLPINYLECQGDDPLVIALDSDPTARNLIRLGLPDARAPKRDSLSEDSRMLGIGLTRIVIELY
jgi:glycosyltransferase involved in cell wall biosynthesis